MAKYDRISGLTNRQQEYGVTIVAMERLEEVRDGWFDWMEGYLEYGVNYIPSGTVDVSWISTVNSGKQWKFTCSRDNCYHQYPLIWYDYKAQPDPLLQGMVVERTHHGEAY